jgi:hypothetical protein
MQLMRYSTRKVLCRTKTLHAELVGRLRASSHAFAKARIISWPQPHGSQPIAQPLELRCMPPCSMSEFVPAARLHYLRSTRAQLTTDYSTGNPILTLMDIDTFLDDIFGVDDKFVENYLNVEGSSLVSN